MSQELERLERLYLDARYSCTALQAVEARRLGREKTRRLKEALDQLCLELRSILREAGRDRVSTVFPRELLAKPRGELHSLCRGSAEKLLRETGSKAAKMILEALRELE